MQHPTPAIVHVTGFSNSGKTHLIERLVPALAHAGRRVATVKHAHKGYDLDRPGKDSDRHRRAGAVATVLFGPDGWAVLHNESPPSHELDAARRAVGASCDLLIVEGFKQTPGPRILIPNDAGDVPDVPTDAPTHVLPTAPWSLTASQLDDVVSFCTAVSDGTV